jgi:hypothetical protein
MALLNFAYFKQIRPVQSTFTPATPITTSVVTEDVEVLPFPAALGISAASTLIADKFSKTFWYSAKPWSAYFASASAATNSAAVINFF